MECASLNSPAWDLAMKRKKREVGRSDGGNCILAAARSAMETDILEWWAAQEKEFPNLSVMTRQYLRCPATSASAEGLFIA